MCQRFKFATALTIVWSALALTACKNNPLIVNLSPGYLGDVEINCGSTREDVKPINIGISGRVDDAVCPQHKMDLKITRNGNSVNPTGNVIWEATGDGIFGGYPIQC